jgi:hypothetical protein
MNGLRDFDREVHPFRLALLAAHGAAMAIPPGSSSPPP